MPILWPEIPAYLMVLPLMDIVGRKPLFSGPPSSPHVAQEASCSPESPASPAASWRRWPPALPPSQGGFRTVLAMTGKFFASSNFAVVYM